MRGGVGALFAHQLRYEQRTFWRNPAGVFFTLTLPVVLLVVFSALNEDEAGFVDRFGPGMLVFGLANAGYGNLAARMVVRRETGQLKRLRSTPLPPYALVAGAVANAVLVAAVTSALVLAVAAVALDGPLPERIGTFAVSIAVGAAACCALGLAVTTVIPNADAADPMVFATLLPIVFVSGLFQPVPTDSPIHRIADLFPISHLYEAARSAYAGGGGAGFPTVHLLIVAAWGAAGALVAAHRRRWEPRR